MILRRQLPGIFSALTTSLVLIACAPNSGKVIDYPGTDRPDSTAILFAPGLISTEAYEHSSPAFSPDGTVVLWTRLDQSYRASMLEMAYADGTWSAPRRPSFADSTADDYYPSFSPDGKKLYFSSRRKMPEGYPPVGDMRIWQVERKANGWGIPVPIDTTITQGNEYAHSVSDDGTLFFSAPMGAMNFNISRADVNRGKSKPLALPYDINSVGYEDGPYVAPDGSFLIFESQRPQSIEGGIDLYISFKTKPETWSHPINMGPKINSAQSERFARLSPDGRYLFFGSSRNQSATNRGFDIYWIDAGIIDELRATAIAISAIELPLGDDLIVALNTRNAEQSATLLSTWLEINPKDLDATVIYSASLRRQARFDEANKLLESAVENWRDEPAIQMELGLVKFGLEDDEQAERILDPMLTGNQLRERLLNISSSLLDMKKVVLSDKYFERAMSLGAGGFPYYRRAEALALLGEKDRAFAALNKAVDLGHTDRNRYADNPDFGSLKSDNRWALLMHRLK